MDLSGGKCSSYVFLSYASADRERALHIAELIEGQGISVWIDRKSIAGGTSWSAEIVSGIEGSAALVILCTVGAMNSPNVQQEVQLAWEGRKPILHLLLEKVQLPNVLRYALAVRQWIEVLDHPDADWLPAAARGLRGLGIKLDPPGPGDETPATPTTTNADAAQSPIEEALTRNNLPLAFTSFVGRGRELAEVSERLAETHLLTLTGAGGCGKTRLALQVATNRLDTYPDGVWFVDLAPLTDPTLVLPTVMTTLGVADVPGRVPLAVLGEYLRRRIALLVLDNCEHLIDACARLIEVLLQRCPHLWILATSREVLGVAGELAWRVPSLTLRDPQQPTSRDGESAIGSSRRCASMPKKSWSRPAKRWMSATSIGIGSLGLPIASRSRVTVHSPLTGSHSFSRSVTTCGPVWRGVRVTRRALWPDFDLLFTTGGSRSV